MDQDTNRRNGVISKRVVPSPLFEVDIILRGDPKDVRRPRGPDTLLSVSREHFDLPDEGVRVESVPGDLTVVRDPFLLREVVEVYFPKDELRRDQGKTYRDSYRVSVGNGGLGLGSSNVPTSLLKTSIVDVVCRHLTDDSSTKTSSTRTGVHQTGTCSKGCSRVWGAPSGVYVATSTIDTIGRPKTCPPTVVGPVRTLGTSFTMVTSTTLVSWRRGTCLTCRRRRRRPTSTPRGNAVETGFLTRRRGEESQPKPSCPGSLWVFYGPILKFFGIPFRNLLCDLLVFP